MRRRMVFIVPAAIVGILVFMAVGGWLVMLLWNWLLPALFGWRALTFWQALGMLALCRMLFGGFGWHRAGGGWRRRRMEERCGNMTPEEREQMRQRMRERMREFWGFGPPAGGSAATGENKVK